LNFNWFFDDFSIMVISLHHTSFCDKRTVHKTFYSVFGLDRILVYSVFSLDRILAYSVFGLDRILVYSVFSFDRILVYSKFDLDRFYCNGPKRNVNLICYHYIPTYQISKSISQSIAKKSGHNCFISELRTWVTLYVSATLRLGHKKNKWQKKFLYNLTKYLVVTTFFRYAWRYWFLVYECVIMSYRSSVHFVPVQWFLVELWPFDFEILPYI
jgi:hypothetical protein